MMPFVEAFNDLCTSDEAFAAGVSQFEGLAAAISKTSALKDFMCSPAVNKADRETVLSKAFKTAKFEDLVYKLVVMMLKKNAFSHYSVFVSLLRETADERLRIARGSVETAVGLSQEAQKKIEKILADLTGKTPELTYHVEASHLGGMRVKMKDLSVDGTVRRKLNDAKVALKSKRA
jgi:F0F1-type ATP synthase delta subunit